jgi:hypothetical protein
MRNAVNPKRTRVASNRREQRIDHHGSITMNRYPNNRASPLAATAAVAATIATIALAVVLPATMTARPSVEASVLAKREARQAEVTVTLERVETLAAQPAPEVTGAAAALPVAAATLKPRV